MQYYSLDEVQKIAHVFSDNPNPSSFPYFKDLMNHAYNEGYEDGTIEACDQALERIEKFMHQFIMEEKKCKALPIMLAYSDFQEEILEFIKKLKGKQ